MERNITVKRGTALKSTNTLAVPTNIREINSPRILKTSWKQDDPNIVQSRVVMSNIDDSLYQTEMNALMKVPELSHKQTSTFDTSHAITAANSIDS